MRGFVLLCGLKTDCRLSEVVTACSFFEGPVVHSCNDSVCRWLPTDRLAYVLDHEPALLKLAHGFTLTHDSLGFLDEFQ